jgi:glyoxalase family protein
MITPTGLHHVTAVASDPQANVDFYAGLLGLRLVKRTVNFDDPSAYHLYYGDETGAPGSIMTFFYWPRHGAAGRVGSGQVTNLVYSAPPAALAFWQERLSRHGVAAARQERFGESVLALSDPDGIPIEIVAVADDSRLGWSASGSGIPGESALRGFHATELTVHAAGPTEALLTGEMEYRRVRREGRRARFEAGPGGSGHLVDVIEDATRPPGVQGTGTVHHVAWRVPDDAAELAMQARLQEAGVGVSDVRDRDYFRSIYYREPGGILFEIATDVPGFAVDEAVASLGTALRLPRQFERARRQIEALLPPLQPARRYA